MNPTNNCSCTICTPPTCSRYCRATTAGTRWSWPGTLLPMVAQYTEPTEHWECRVWTLLENTVLMWRPQSASMVAWTRRSAPGWRSLNAAWWWWNRRRRSPKLWYSIFRVWDTPSENLYLKHNFMIFLVYCQIHKSLQYIWRRDLPLLQDSLSTIIILYSVIRSAGLIHLQTVCQKNVFHIHEYITFMIISWLLSCPQITGIYLYYCCTDELNDNLLMFGMSNCSIDILLLKNITIFNNLIFNTILILIRCLLASQMKNN